MYNHQHSEWNTSSKIDWNNERSESSVGSDFCSRNDYSMMPYNNNHNAPYEYGHCLEKNAYFNENYSTGEYYGMNNYLPMYQACSDDEWMTTCSNSNCQSSQLNNNYSLSTSYYQQQHYSPQQQQQQQQHVYWSKYHSVPMHGPQVIGSNYQANMAGTSSSAITTVSDPLNALQNLTVSAGQPAQMIAQQNIRLNSTAYSNQIRQRSLVQGSINRPIEAAYPATRSPLPQQLMQAQIPSNVVISNSNVVNARMPNNAIVMKSEICMNQNNGLLMLPPYSMDSSNSLMNSPQSVTKSTSGKLAQYNVTMPSQYQSSKEQFQMSNQPSLTVSSNNIFPPGNSSKLSLSSTITARPPSIISEDEAKKAKEEIKKFKERYFKKLIIILESPKSCSEEEIKVWTALKNLLENPDSIGKPLSMKHIVKIEQHLMKAEQYLINKNQNQPSNNQSVKQYVNTSQTSSQVPCLSSGRKIQKPGTNYDEPVMKPSMFSMLNDSSDNIDASSGFINFSSLDIAFDDVCHQLTNTDSSLIKRVQHNLIEYVKSRQPQYRHFLPKRVFIDLDKEDIVENNKSKRMKMDSQSIDDEFSILKNIENDEEDLFTCKNDESAIDENKLLRLDLNFGHINMDLCNLEQELKILNYEFQITKLEEQPMSKDWISYESDWKDSQFYSFLYEDQNFPSSVPPIKLRISVDYDESGYTDWNLNLDLYPLHIDDFLTEVANILTSNFSEAHRNYQWSGIPLLYVISLYKRSIITAYGNYISRINVEQ